MIILVDRQNATRVQVRPEEVRPNMHPALQAKGL